MTDPGSTCLLVYWQHCLRPMNWTERMGQLSCPLLKLLNHLIQTVKFIWKFWKQLINSPVINFNKNEITNMVIFYRHFVIMCDFTMYSKRSSFGVMGSGIIVSNRYLGVPAYGVLSLGIALSKWSAVGHEVIISSKCFITRYTMEFLCEYAGTKSSVTSNVFNDMVKAPWTKISELES